MSDSRKDSASKMPQDAFTPNELSMEAAQTSTVGFHFFATNVNAQGPDTVYYFTEGDTDKGYYDIRVRKFSGREAFCIPCGCKKNVLVTYNELRARAAYSAYYKLFFVDHDYDEFINNSEIYETECYSIENYYTGDEFVCNFIEGKWGITQDDNPVFFLKALSEYDCWEEDFVDSVRDFCAWYKLAKHNFPKGHRYFKSSVPENVFKFAGGKVIKGTYNLSSLNKQFPPREGGKPVEHSEWERERNSEWNLGNIRGKFALQFMDEFLQHLRKVGTSSTGVRLSYEPNRKTMMENFSEYARTPQMLKEYIMGSIPLKPKASVEVEG